jgi:hypothetical protein
MLSKKNFEKVSVLGGIASIFSFIYSLLPIIFIKEVLLIVFIVLMIILFLNK